METLLQTPDPVLVSFAQALLKEAGLTVAIFDQNIAMTEGSVGIFPRRVAVPSEQAAEGRRLLIEAGLEQELTRE